MEKTIALIFGGEGKEHDISIASAKYIYDILQTTVYKIVLIYIDRNGNWYSGNDITDTSLFLTPVYPIRLGGACGFFSEGRIISVDAAIVALHGDRGEDGVVQGALESANISVIGQSVLSSVLTNDKAACKAVSDSLGIPSAAWLLLTDDDAYSAARISERQLRYPMFLKSCSYGSSFGVCKVSDRDEFISAYEEIRETGERRIIAEEALYCDYELECAYVDCGEKYFLPSGVIPSGGRFYDNSGKYGADSPFLPQVRRVDESIRRKVIGYSELLVEKLGIEYLARLDFFVVGDSVYFNEINCFPGMTPASLYPAMIDEELFGFREFLTRLIEYALSK